MKLTTTTAVDVRASAVLQPDGSLDLRITAHAAYADGMHTSIALDRLGGGEAAAARIIAEQLAALVKANAPIVAKRITSAIHDSRRIGRAQGELDENFNPIPPQERDDDA